MDVIIYSFFIVTGIAGLSYITIRKRYARLLEEEQDKSYMLRNNEIQLLSEKQRLDSALREKERQIAEIKSSISSEESRTVSLGSELLEKDKQIQSLTAQLQHEASQRNAIEREREEIERQLSEFISKISAEESKSSTLSVDVTQKEETIRSLSDEVQRQKDEREALAAKLEEQERQAEHLASQISEAESQRDRMTGEFMTKEQQLQSDIDRQTAEIQQLQEQLRSSAVQRTEAETLLQQNVHDLQSRIDQLQKELAEVRSAEESVHGSRDSLLEEFHTKEQEWRRQLAEAEQSIQKKTDDLRRTSEELTEQRAKRETAEHALDELQRRFNEMTADHERKFQEQEAAAAALRTHLEAKTNDLTAAEQSIHNMLRLIPVPVVVVNERGICEYCNAPLEELVGYGMNELSGNHFARLFPEDERPFYTEQWENIENRTEQFRGDTPIVAATNDPISASVNFVEIAVNSETKKYVGFILDRTTEKDSQKHFQAAKEREQELLDLKSRFIGMVSNQLRTSLVTIATNAELLERFVDRWSDERRYHSFMRINESIRQMIDLVRDVTFTTRATTESYTLSLSEVNLETLLQETATDVMNDLESHHHFILSEQGNISSVTLDEQLIRTIMAQLFSNAFKYSRDKTDVRVHVDHSASSCVITITDQGIGIPAAEQKYLFSTFFRASNVSNIYGTGLGLTIVQQCVQRHGGFIAIESTLNKGTKVMISIPVPAAS